MQTPIFTTIKDIKYGVYKLSCGKTPAGKYSLSIHLDSGVNQSIGKAQLCDDVYGKNGEFFDLSKAVTISKGDTLTLFIETKAQHFYIVISVGATSKTETSKVTISLYNDAASSPEPEKKEDKPAETQPEQKQDEKPVSTSEPVPAGCVEIKHVYQCSLETYKNIKHDSSTAYLIV